MCGPSTSYHSHSSPEVPSRSTQTETKSASRRIDPNELAKQVATLVQNSGKVTRQETIDGVRLTEYKLARGETKALVQTGVSPFGQSSSYVQVKRGRKLLLTADALGTGAQAQFDNASFVPGSWTKPFRLVDLSASQG